jgi:hypothetical protein
MNAPAMRRAAPTIWNGTRQEAGELLEAVSANCTCVRDAAGIRTAICEAHRMLVTDQRALNGLVFARRIASRFRAEEFREEGA